MQFEVIRKSHKKEVVVGVVAIILIAVVLVVRNSFAKYQTTKNMKIAEGTINYTVPDFKIMGIYYQKEGQTCTEDNCYEEKESMPESGYTINTTKSYCELNGNKDNNAEMYTDENGQHVISKLTKGDRCYLYFDKVVKASDTILAGITVKNGTPDFSKTATTDEGVFKASDDDGTSYYFRGAVENNYVKFANKYWRIIRINGDGTIRIVYDGTSARVNGTSSSATQIGTLAFNTSIYGSMYVGFMYEQNQVHGLKEKSNILLSTEVAGLEKWYKANLEKYESYIDKNAGFCGDRTPSTSSNIINDSGGTGTTTTYYGGYIRLVNSSKAPTLECSTEDFYTKKSASKGNKVLDYPVGLVTADEMVMAGAVLGIENQNYYLYTGQSYWTLSPHYSSSVSAEIFAINFDGQLVHWNVNNMRGVRPVINLKADTKFTYNIETTKGTASDPYVV